MNGTWIIRALIITSWEHLVGTVINPAKLLAWKLLAPNAPISQTSRGARCDWVSHSPISGRPMASLSRLLELVSTAVTWLVTLTIHAPGWHRWETGQTSKS